MNHSIDLLDDITVLSVIRALVSVASAACSSGQAEASEVAIMLFFTSTLIDDYISSL